MRPRLRPENFSATRTRAGVFRLQKKEKIRDRTEFLTLSRSGKKLQNHYFIVIFMPGVYPWPRLGITASRRVGNAVTRNRLKRVIREWFRLNKRAVTASLDINIIAKKSAAELTSGEVFVSLNKIFESVWESRH